MAITARSQDCDRSAESWRLVDAQSGRTVVQPLEVADGYWSRLMGWQFRRRPEQGHGLLLVPCSSVHTCFLRFTLDLVLLDSKGRVVTVRNAVRPWRAILPDRRTYAILELPSGPYEIRAGQSLRVAGPPNVTLPKSLAFLAE
jgi:uncharacterized protein